MAQLFPSASHSIRYSSSSGRVPALRMRDMISLRLPLEKMSTTAG